VVRNWTHNLISKSHAVRFLRPLTLGNPYLYKCNARELQTRQLVIDMYNLRKVFHANIKVEESIVNIINLCIFTVTQSLGCFPFVNQSFPEPQISCEFINFRSFLIHLKQVHVKRKFEETYRNCFMICNFDLVFPYNHFVIYHTNQNFCMNLPFFLLWHNILKKQSGWNIWSVIVFFLPQCFLTFFLFF